MHTVPRRLRALKSCSGARSCYEGGEAAGNQTQRRGMESRRWTVVAGRRFTPPWLRLRHAITYRCSGLKLIERVAPATLSHYRMRPPDALVRCWLERGLDDHDPCCHAMLRLFGGQCQGVVSLAVSFRFGLHFFFIRSCSCYFGDAMLAPV